VFVFGVRGDGGSWGGGGGGVTVLCICFSRYLHICNETQIESELPIWYIISEM
jgi:hypothetical protein